MTKTVRRTGEPEKMRNSLVCVWEIKTKAGGLKTRKELI